MLFILILIGHVSGVPLRNDDLGTFWQVSDFHFDSNYSIDGVRSKYCHLSDESSDGTTLGKFGDRGCDAPWLLATSAVDAMKKFKADPDFILWTGDNSPHVPDSLLNMEKVYTTIYNITDLLRVTFPDAPIYPCMGNHDSYPANQISDDKSYYEGFLKTSTWDDLVPKDSHGTFLKGGYYSTEVRPGLHLIVLNTNMYFVMDKLTANVTDPADQLQWLEEILKGISASGEKAYVVGHVPPGVSPDLWKWMYPDINQHLTNILRKYHNVVIAGIFAHEHTDNFRIIYDENGMSVVPLFMGPAVTPWNKKNNPSMRLYTYNKQTGVILDYEEYYLDLSAANEEGEANWWPLYQAGQSYGISDLSAKSMQMLLDSLSFNSTTWSFRNYWQHFSTGFVQGKLCNETCWVQHICSIKCVDFNCFDKCLKTQKLSISNSSHLSTSDDQSVSNTTSEPICPSWDPQCDHGHHHLRPVPRYMRHLMYILTALVLILFAVVTYLCCCRPRRVYLTRPRYTPLLSNDYESFKS